MHELIREALKEGLKQGLIEVVKDTLIWGAGRLRDRYFPVDEDEDEDEDEDGKNVQEDA